MAPDCVSLRLPLDRLRQAEVGDVRIAVRVDEDVARLEVAMQDAALMGMMDRPGDLDHHLRRRLRVLANFARCALRLPPSMSFMVK